MVCVTDDNIFNINYIAKDIRTVITHQEKKYFTSIYAAGAYKG